MFRDLRIRYKPLIGHACVFTRHISLGSTGVVRVHRQQALLGASVSDFVIDSPGTAIIHPKLQGVNILKADDLPNQYLMVWWFKIFRLIYYGIIK